MSDKNSNTSPPLNTKNSNKSTIYKPINTQSRLVQFTLANVGPTKPPSKSTLKQILQR